MSGGHYVSTYKPALPDTLDSRKEVLATGAVGVDFHRFSAPNLARSEVLKMLTEQEQSHHGYHPHHVQHMEWPPAGHDQPSSFFTAIETADVKKVAWPPVEPEGYEEQPYQEYQAVHSVQRHKNSPPPPSTMALRQEIPLRQPPQPVYQSTPTANKSAKKWRGDLKWPPEHCRAAPEESQQETGKRRREIKDYSRFFASHELPNNYPGYRVPPGTQYFRASGDMAGHSDM